MKRQHISPIKLCGRAVVGSLVFFSAILSALQSQLDDSLMKPENLAITLRT